MSDARSLVALIPRLRRYARALVGDRATADDLVQDTLERAWSKLQLFREGTDLRAWLFTVMHNVHVNRIRAARQTEALDEEMPELAQRAAQGDALMIRDLDRAIATLPVAQREVLLLVALEDLSYEETARVLGIPIRIRRRRKRTPVMPSGVGGFTRLHKTMCATPLVPFAPRATASLGRFFGCAKTATSLSPALTHPTGGRPGTDEWRFARRASSLEGETAGRGSPSAPGPAHRHTRLVTSH
jgi:RNA polymerase sigma-70 factor (ECF subfamily)